MIIKDHNGTKITTPEEIATVLQAVFATYDEIEQGKEHFYTVLLNTRNKIIGIDLTSVGTLNASIVHPRDIFSRAIAANAASIMIAHNHPSGDCDPSNDDGVVTRRISEAGKIMGIELVDHIIFTPDTFKSFKEKGAI